MPEEKPFVHLHVHTDHSLLDGCSRVDRLCKRAAELNMPALAMTDHGNLFGAIAFSKAAKKAGIKPIIGCEIYLVHDHRMTDRPRRDRKRSDDIDDIPDGEQRPEDFPKNQIHHKTILASTFEGYQNLSRLVSDAHTNGFYYRPRTDMEQLAAHGEGLIGLSGCMNGVASQYLIYNDYKKARAATAEFVDIFGKDNYYIEIQDHGMSFQRRIIPGLLKLAKEFELKVVCANDAHYVLREDSAPHDALLCIQTGKLVTDEGRLKYPSQEFYLKSHREMLQVFKEIPESLTNTLEVAERCNVEIPLGENHYPVYERPAEIIVREDPDNFDRILDVYVREQNRVLKQNGKPEDAALSAGERAEFRKNGLYLFDLCKQGLQERYKIDYDAVRARGKDFLHANPGDGRFEPGSADYAREVCDKMDYELAIITGTGFVDYFLITWDFINWARQQGIPVGPGRGSGAGCLVAYVLKITDIDPLAHGLLFERMLSLERVSPPDFDVDFCKRRRDEVVDYVREKYGRDRVANIITFGTFGAKMIVRDLARVLEVPFTDADKVAKMVPEDLNISLDDAMEKSGELRGEVAKNPISKKIIDWGKVIEGMVRNTGKHACGIIIGDQPITNLVPVTIQEGDLTTQYPKGPVEDLGMLKADFLGLKTLTVISDAQDNVRLTTANPDFDIEQVSLDDKKTYELLNTGHTTGVFQLESEGMQNLCRRLGLSEFEEIIALIALYRPGPMQFIDQYIEGKKNPATIKVPHPKVKDLVEETYGVLVYQEQVMQVAQIIAGYTLGNADILRRAMGKKIKEMMDAQKEVFVQGARETSGLSQKEALDIFALLEKFAEYGFNKSHSAAYAMLSYRTAYLKANYPVEFMAAALSSELGDADKVSHLIRECAQMHVPVLGPDVNESREMFTPVQRQEGAKFAVQNTTNDEAVPPSWERPQALSEGDRHGVDLLKQQSGDAAIRFGMAAIKGVGDGAAKAIIAEREAHGSFADFTDFIRRVDPRAVNKRVTECLVKSGAFDFTGEDRGILLDNVEAAMKEAAELQRDAEIGQNNFLGMLEGAAPEPRVGKNRSGNGRESGGENPGNALNGRPMPEAERLQHERELLGFYISGHPLDAYAGLAETLNHLDLAALEDAHAIAGGHGKVSFRLCGIVSGIQKKLARRDNRPWAAFTLSTKTDNYDLKMFSDAYEAHGAALTDNAVLVVHGNADKREGELRLTVAECFRLDHRLARLFDRIVIDLEPEEARAYAFLEDLRGLIDERRGRGNTRVCLRFPTAGIAANASGNGPRNDHQAHGGGSSGASDANATSQRGGAAGPTRQSTAYLEAELPPGMPLELDSTLLKSLSRKSGVRAITAIPAPPPVVEERKNFGRKSG